MTRAMTKVPQPHGGSLNHGGTKGNKGGTGPPASVIRAACRLAFSERVPLLQALADGEALKRIQVPLAFVLQFAACPRCGGQLKKMAEAKSPEHIIIEGSESASPGDRIRSVDALGKYGMSDNVSKDDVRGKLSETIAVIRQYAPAEAAVAILADLQSVWQL